MTAPPPRRPRWRRKRTWAAVALWLLLPPALAGWTLLAGYSAGRGWIEPPTAGRLCGPLLPPLFYYDRGGGLREAWGRVYVRATDLGNRHAASD